MSTGTAGSSRLTVKPSPLSAEKRIAKALDGWQLLVVTLVVAWGTALVVVPRPVEPRDLPVPRVEPRSATSVRDRDRDLAASLLTRPLDTKLRRLGTAVRTVGKYEESSDPQLSAARDEAKDAAKDALRLSGPDVLRLRAYQTDRFLEELSSWVRSGQSTNELVELGGSVVRSFQTTGWIVSENGKRRVLLGDLALRAAYKKRWNEVTGITADTLAISIDEQRAFLAFTIEHPANPPSSAGLGNAVAMYQNQMTLNKIDELAKIDPTYPVLFAKGIVFYRVASYANAATAFGRYLEERPDGPYAVRAANFLKASLEKSGD